MQCSVAMSFVAARRSVARCALTLALTACAAPLGEPDDELVENTLLGGRYTFDRPEVGSIRVGGGACTATLFGSARTVITAAHCVDYGTARGPGRYGTFTLAPREGEQHDYTIAQYVSYGRSSEGSEADVALIQLAEAVPASVARPDPPPGAHPPRGTRMAIYGYGCQNRSSQSGRFAKQVIEFDWGSDTRNLCPGDSGGPTLTPDAEVVTVNSAYLIGPGTDLFGDVVRYLDRLRTQVEQWAEGEPLVWVGDTGPGGGVEPPPAPPPTTPPDDHTARCGALGSCAACTGDSYCGWCGRCVPLVVGEGGAVSGQGCTGQVTLSPAMCGGGAAPPPPAPPPGSDCGELASVTTWTCDASAYRFVRCGARGVELEVCPEGYYCPPGSTRHECLWGDYGRR
ncbi:MAG: trypsin-like serine protease [Sandaracinaceae bacterium]|nr:trypsin-like serine protease [Sandaracinaceae bacterium]